MKTCFTRAQIFVHATPKEINGKRKNFNYRGTKLSIDLREGQNRKFAKRAPPCPPCFLARLPVSPPPSLRPAFSIRPVATSERIPERPPTSSALRRRLTSVRPRARLQCPQEASNCSLVMRIQSCGSARGQGGGEGDLGYGVRGGV